MLLMLVRLAFHHLIHPGLAAGDIKILVVSKALFPHGDVTAAGPGGVAYLVVCREAVDHCSPVRIGNHRQVVRFVIQPLAVQGVVAPVVRILFVQVTGLLVSQHSRRGVTLAEAEPGFTLPGYFLAAQVVLKNQGSMVRYMPRGQVTHKTAGKVLSNTGGGALRDRIQLCIVAVLCAPAINGFSSDPAGVIIFIRDGGVVVAGFSQAAESIVSKRCTTENPVAVALHHFLVWRVCVTCQP